jgi:GNAT superfamily N-acetyltransferase
MVFEVDAEFRRQGIATQLMRALLKQPDYEAGRLPIYVEASPLGKMFYQNCGFELLRDVELFDGKAMLSAMVRRKDVKN